MAPGVSIRPSEAVTQMSRCAEDRAVRAEGVGSLDGSRATSQGWPVTEPLMGRLKENRALDNLHTDVLVNVTNGSPLLKSRSLVRPYLT